MQRQTPQPTQQGKAAKTRRRISRTAKILIGFVITILLLAIWIANIIGKIPDLWGINPTQQAGILTAVAAVLAAFFAFVPIIPEDKVDTPEPVALPPLPPIAIHISAQLQSDTLQLSSIQETSISTITCFLFPPIPTDTISIQQREIVVREVYAALTTFNRSSVVLVGMGGIGKSTLAALVFNYAEQQRKAGKGPFIANAIWLSIGLNATFLELVKSVFSVLNGSMPDFTKLSPRSLAYEFFQMLNASDEKARLIVLDQFENFLDEGTGHARFEDPGVGDFIDVFNSQPCACRILLTSRPKPVGTREDFASCMHTYPVSGMSIDEGVALLQSQQVQGRNIDLRKAVESCKGHGLALKLLILLLNAYGVSLSTFLTDPSYMHYWEDNIATKLLDKIYMEHLSPVAQQLLQAFCVYREAVPVEAVYFILDRIASNKLRLALKELPQQNLFSTFKEGYYELHPIVASYAEKQFGTSNLQIYGNRVERVLVILRTIFKKNNLEDSKKALQIAHFKAAHYYEQKAIKDLPEFSRRKNVRDIQVIIEIVWHYCKAKQWQNAFDIISKEKLFDYLMLWGANALLLDLCQLLLSERWPFGAKQTALIYSYCAIAQGVLGQRYEALGNQERGLQLYREAKDDLGESATLNNIGGLYNALGKWQIALEYYNQALQMVVEKADYRRVEGVTLNNMGFACNAIGEKQKALEHYKQALVIRKEIGDRVGEGETLHNLGGVYDDLGEQQKALEYYKQALVIRKEVGDRLGEGKTLHSLGIAYLVQNNYRLALAYLLLARRIFQDMQDLGVSSVGKWIASLRTEMGEESFATLLAQVESRAEQVVEEAMREVRNGGGMV